MWQSCGVDNLPGYARLWLDAAAPKGFWLPLWEGKYRENSVMFFSGARCPAGCTLQAGGDWFCDSVITDKISTTELSQTSSWMKDQSFLLWAQYYFYFPPSRE